MKQDEIIETAKQAGLIVNSPYLMPHDHVMRGIEAFAKLVAAKEREACALIALDAPLMCLRQDTREACADAIRARGEA